MMETKRMLHDVIHGKKRSSPNVGRIFYSPQYGKEIIVTAFTNNREWWFKFKDSTEEIKAGTSMQYYIDHGYERRE